MIRFVFAALLIAAIWIGWYVENKRSKRRLLLAFLIGFSGEISGKELHDMIGGSIGGMYDALTSLVREGHVAMRVVAGDSVRGFRDRSLYRYAKKGV